MQRARNKWEKDTQAKCRRIGHEGSGRLPLFLHMRRIELLKRLWEAISAIKTENIKKKKRGKEGKKEKKEQNRAHIYADTLNVIIARDTFKTRLTIIQKHLHSGKQTLLQQSDQIRPVQGDAE